MMNLLDPGSASRFHLSENVLTRLVDRELSPVRRLLVSRHLNKCSKCQARYAPRVRTALDIVEYRQGLLKRIGPLPPARRQLFIRELDGVLQAAHRPRGKQLLPRPEARPFRSFRPAFTSVAILIVAGILLFSISRSPLSTVSAAEFLNRAVASDHRSAKVSGYDIICRRLLINTSHKTFQHAIYRDLSRRRQPRYAKPSAEELDLAARLALTGVSWDDPLSAASFKSWHDRQTSPTDIVRSSADGLLTMSTRLPSTNILQESLTVKESTFHPIKRTVEYRKAGTIEISEVSVDVLSADDAQQFFFEVQPITTAAIPRISAPGLPSTAELNETELQARLTLNRMNADTGEQIDITRDSKQVRVKGVVESEERKRELRRSLQALPFLAVTIESFDDLKSAASPILQPTSPHLQSALAQVSPLEEYFVEHGRTRDDLSRISAALFNHSLAINRSARSIDQIALRFSAKNDLSPTAIHARDELLSRNIERLLKDLREQKQFLEETWITFESNPSPTQAQADASHLSAIAERNMTATRWLISGPPESGRSEMLKTKVAEIAETISQLRAAAFTCIPSVATPQEQ